jgi:uncharacterized protein YqfA (UPF0365 family)
MSIALAATGTLVIVGVAAAAIFLLFFLGFFARFGNLYIRALMAGAYVPIAEIVGMSLRRVDPVMIVDCRIMGLKGGLEEGTGTAELERHCLAGGNVRHVVEALVAARAEGVPLTFGEACAMDLAGQDAVEFVRSAGRTAEDGPSEWADGHDRWAMVAVVGEPPEEGATLEVVQVESNVVYLERV